MASGSLLASISATARSNFACHDAGCDLNDPPEPLDPCGIHFLLCQQHTEAVFLLDVQPGSTLKFADKPCCLRLHIEPQACCRYLGTKLRVFLHKHSCWLQLRYGLLVARSI